MPWAGQPVTSHASIVPIFVGRLTEWCQTDDQVAGLDVYVDDIRFFYSAGQRVVDGDGSYQITDVSGLSAGGVNVDAEFTHFCAEFFSAVDDGSDDFSRNQVFVPSDGRGKQHGHFCRSDTDEVVQIHDDAILRDSFPDGHITGLFPVDVGKRCFCACTVSMDDVAVFRIACEHVGDDLAECFGEYPFVDLFDRSMDLFLVGGDTSFFIIAFFSMPILGEIDFFDVPDIGLCIFPFRTCGIFPSREESHLLDQSWSEDRLIEFEEDPFVISIDDLLLEPLHRFFKRHLIEDAFALCREMTDSRIEFGRVGFYRS